MNVDISEDNAKIYNAAYDYKYLLSRGYPTKSSLDLVTTRYSLNEKERLILYRCIHPYKYVEEIKRKLICNKLNEYTLLIDFYNILISVINMIKGGEVYMCDDCVPRDLRGSKLRKDDELSILDAMNLMAYTIKAMEPRYIVLVVDKNVSHSFSHTITFGNILKALDLEYSYEITSTPDKKLIDSSKSNAKTIVATSDSVIMMNSLRIAPITISIMHILGIRPVYNFANIFNSDCSICLDNLIQAINKNCKGYT